MSYQSDVENFMKSADQTVEIFPKTIETNAAQARLYMDLIREEFLELETGFTSNNITEIADGGADLVWVIMGLFSTLGINFDGIWEEVKASNMSKVSETGKILKREDGKVLKPETYFKPDINKVLRKQGI